jgi:hypothetical protein
VGYGETPSCSFKRNSFRTTSLGFPQFSCLKKCGDTVGESISTLQDNLSA